MRKYKACFAILLYVVFLSACSQRRDYVERTDTKTSGEAFVVVDETLMPIVNEQVDVFEGLYPEAKINSAYVGELEAYHLFSSDSIHLLVGTRPLTDSELGKIEMTKRKVRTKRLAVDGIALIINKDNPDFLLRLDQVTDIMTGKITNWDQINSDSKLGEIRVVFDRPNSSTARFISDSITKSTEFAPNITAIADDFVRSDSVLKESSNREVIDYVIGHKNAIGVLGVNWISDPRDSTGLTFDSRVNVVSINNPQVEDGTKYYKPYAAFLGLKYYPLSRDVYVMISDMYTPGLYSGFVDFMVGEKGQRMVNKSGLFPANIPTRLIKVTPMSEL